MNIYEFIPIQNPDVGILLLRIAVGLLIFLHGFPKLTNISGLAGYFESIKIPLPKVSAVISILTETIGGLFLIFGLLTPISSFVIVINMIVATVVAKVNQKRPLIMNNDMIAGLEIDLLYLFGSIAILLIGPGIYSLDFLLF